jgi:predicted porin
MTLYSIVHAQSDATGNVTKLTIGVHSGSRLGFKGSKDLCSDLTFGWQLTPY